MYHVVQDLPIVPVWYVIWLKISLNVYHINQHDQPRLLSPGDYRAWLASNLMQHHDDSYRVTSCSCKVILNVH